MLRIFVASLIMLSSLVAAQTPIISGYSYEHESKVLQQQRRYMVSLPERYHAGDRRYPTLYVIDADFQFQHVSALVNNLSRMGKIPPMIVVGVAMQGDDDYVWGTTWPVSGEPAYGGAAKLQQYLVQELVPRIEQEFRCNSQRALAGYSLGGLFTLYSMMQADTPFNAFLAMSPSAWFDEQSINSKLGSYLERTKQTRAPLFISVANEQGMGVTDAVEIIKQHPLSGWSWQFKSYPNESHFSTAAPALYDALQFLAPDFYIDPQDMMTMKDYSAVLDALAQKKTLWTGFRFEWLQAYSFAKYIFWSKQQQKVDEILADIAKRFPESLTEVSIQLAAGFNKKQQPQQAQKILQRVQQSAQQSANWYKQMSVSYAQLEQADKAAQYQQTALALADKQQLPSWQVWELH